MALLGICGSVATTVIQDLVNKACEQLGYLCKYESYVEDFKNKQKELLAIVKSVELKIEEAKKRNRTRVDPIVEHWLEKANELLQQDTKPTKCFGSCTNFSLQIEQAKDLENLTKEIPTLIAKVDNFDVVAHDAGVPGMEFHSQQFMTFESRKANFEKLKKELEDDNNYMIGLQGLGGTGKSTMAIEVGKHVEKSNAFNRVIFINVSTPVEEKRIRDDIARHLELQLEEEKKLTHAQQLWNKIADAGKVLIILDDVWEKLDLKNMGIQPGFHNKGHCSVLLTTRNKNVCTQMGCQMEIKLEDLSEDDALNLFTSHAIKVGHGQNFPDDLKKVAVQIVNECGRLPVIVVAMAKTLKDWPIKEWQDALVALKSANEPSTNGIVDENTTKFYNSLNLSYTYLKDKEAQVLFLLCSIFPKAQEIPVELLSRIAIGLGLFGEVDKYYIARSQVHGKKNKLINSSLLLTAGDCEECAKMHDVIREVALKIGNEEIQVIMNSKTNLKENMLFSSWIIDSFPNCFEDSKLKVLLVWINANGSLEVPNTLFGGMKSLRVLLLHSKIEFGRTSALSLPKSIQSLKHIRTLSLTNWELGDISVLMKNLQILESLELTNCSIVELPKGISELDKLRFLCLIHCSVEKNNPFEVIARCSQLEELYYVSNEDHIPILIGEKVAQITSLPKYQIYHIDGRAFSAIESCQLDTSIKNSFKPAKLQRMFSKEVIKSMAASAEILELEGDNEMGWNNLIPSSFSIEDGAMKDLIKLTLNHWSKMKCLIHTEHLQLKSGVSIFSKLVELRLTEVDVREICCGPYPDGFLKQLEKLRLKKCLKLESTLFKGKIDLGNLKSMRLKDCSMTYLFHPPTAQSLRQLETLKIYNCSQLKYIIMDEGSSVEEKVDDKDPNPRSHDSMFPKLKLLNVRGCEQLEFILPICFYEDLPQLESVEISECENLRYMFGQYLEEGGLHQMQTENKLPSLKEMSLEAVQSFLNLYPDCYLPQKLAAHTRKELKTKDKSPSPNVSRGSLCCFLPQSKAISKDELYTSKAAQLDHTASQEKYVRNTAHGIFTPPLYPCNLRRMNIGRVSNSRSLFSESIASSMLLLEILVVFDCDKLEHIVMEEVDGHDHMNANSVFPNLRTIEITSCDMLEYVIPASCSRNFVHLESVLIWGARQLKYVFGKSYGDDNIPHQNQNTEIHLPALNALRLRQVPNMASMCPENYYVKASSLKGIVLGECSQLPINSFIDLSVEGHKGPKQFLGEKVIGMHLYNLKHLGLESLDIETVYDLHRLQIASPLNSSLETMSLIGLVKLKNICVGQQDLHLNFQNLFYLGIFGCNQLKFILSTSISRSMPHLKCLEAFDCEELERIIEEDDDRQECCFSNLQKINVGRCERLKCIFSISTCGSLPKLSVLAISSVPELELVFGGKQDSTQEFHIKHVFPKLFVIFLKDLPKLHTICPSIDFQTVIYRQVQDCPNISLTSTDTVFLDRYWDWLLEESERNKGNSNMDEDYYEKILERLREASEKSIKRYWQTAEQNKGSPNIKEIAEAGDEESPESEEAIKADEVKDSEQTNKFPQDNSVHIEDKGKRTELDQQALPKTEHDMHPDDSQMNIEESVGETSNETSMAIPSTTTEMSSPFIPSISTPKKSEIATSSTETKSESSQSDHLAIHITESAQGITQAETCMSYVSKQLENDDLMRLFQIMDEGADMEVHMPCASKITAHEDYSEVTKALSDLEASLKIDLNEIASFEESRLCVENSLSTLYSHCSHDGLKATIHSLQQEIQTILSSFKQAHATIDTVTELEQKEKLMTEQRLQRKEAAKTLLSEIHMTQNFMVEAQTREAELKEQTSKLQAELCSNEQEIKECEIKLLSLQEQKKKIVSDTIGFIKELEAVKKERSRMVEDQIKARHQLENENSKWSSFLANLKKTSLLFGVHLKNNL
ncbi:hypothetical protein K1719_026224 [Acacia pycnantha]|nr:hypothetical protein K1719_026224 [Acacia pycnantha]